MTIEIIIVLKLNQEYHLANKKSELAKCGHSKEKQNDLRIIGLSLMLSGEDEIPLFCKTTRETVPIPNNLPQQ